MGPATSNTDSEDEPLRFLATRSRGEVSALLRRPTGATGLYVMAHGAGAGMGHPFMAAMVDHFAGAGLATLRYQFPYMETQQRRPDPRPVLLATVRAAVRLAGETCPDLPLIAGGKSMGGRMTSLAAAEAALPGVRGIAFLGFPLHGAGQPPSVVRAEHLHHVEIPMLFLQGTRDKLADLELMTQVCAGLGPRATIEIMDGADHGFHVLKRSGRTDDEVMTQLSLATAAWTTSLGEAPA
jgi:predicted alpha/beta-hydrolase family hydrolase